EAVFARCISAQKEARGRASLTLGTKTGRYSGDIKGFCDDLGRALYAAKIVSYTQGFMLLLQAGRANGWELDLSAIARIWRKGCIIRSVFLDRIAEAFAARQAPEALMLAPYFKDALNKSERAWRTVCKTGVELKIALPAMSGALMFFDAYRCDRSGANMLQAQRDYFGAHAYERIDRPRGEFFHTDWTGHGGTTASGVYGA
ncbi:MAG: hypothetical protein PHC61_19015, partial [Chitinivibrionales bacterium]|nr:hypothetical protein [Chitinivibrionales bacterium]